MQLRHKSFKAYYLQTKYSKIINVGYVCSCTYLHGGCRCVIIEDCIETIFDGCRQQIMKIDQKVFHKYLTSYICSQTLIFSQLFLNTYVCFYLVIYSYSANIFMFDSFTSNIILLYISGGQ